MNPPQAENILGLKQPYTVKQVKAAFGTAVRDAHPDTTDYVGTRTVADVKQARDVCLIVAKREDALAPCGVCGGAGSRITKGTFVARRCGTCNGTGKVLK